MPGKQSSTLGLGGGGGGGDHGGAADYLGSTDPFGGGGGGGAAPVQMRSAGGDDPFGLHIVQRKESGGGAGAGGGEAIKFSTCSNGVLLDPGANEAVPTSGGGDGDDAGAVPIGSPGGSGLEALTTGVTQVSGQGPGADEEGEESEESDGEETAAPAAGGVQRSEGGAGDASHVQRAAAEGVAGAGGELPHRDPIQRSFGMDLSGVSAHVGGQAAQAAQAIGAEAYTTGSDIAFSRQPDLHLAAHEAAHVVQQRSGVSLQSGVGQVGDTYEQHADAVADRVVAGQSAADLLGGPGQAAVAPATQRRATFVQRWQSKRSIAKSLIKIAGTADKADGKLVVKQLLKFKKAALKALVDQGTKVVVCRGSVTEYLANLKGVQPRGWPPGMTWDTVPGLNNSSTNEVVIAVIGHGTKKGAHVPKSGEGHGSYNLTLHESGHAHDLNQGGGKARRSSGADFLKARTADIATLSAYETQAGAAGEQETYAESLARFYGGDPKDAKDHPNLHKYWKDNPIGK